MCITLPESIYTKIFSQLYSDEGKNLDPMEICAETTQSMRESLEKINKEINELMS